MCPSVTPFSPTKKKKKEKEELYKPEQTGKFLKILLDFRVDFEIFDERLDADDSVDAVQHRGEYVLQMSDQVGELGRADAHRRGGGRGGGGGGRGFTIGKTFICVLRKKKHQFGIFCVSVLGKFAFNTQV